MKNTFSCPLFRENLKRFWGFSAVVFMAYFLSTNFVILANTSRVYESQLLMLIELSNPGYIAFNVIAPIVSAVILFGYLTKVNSTTVMHSMPFSRKSLFITNYISGLVLVLIPLLLNTIITIIVKYSIVDPAVEIIGSNGNIHNIFTVAHILKTFGWHVICVLYTYSIAVLAGMISGNSIIHLLTAGAMNFIAIVFYLICQGYGDLFLYGFTESNSMWTAASYTHPVFIGLTNSASYLTGITNGIASTTFLAWVIYAALSIVFTVAAYILYQKRKLEKAGDSYVFNFVKYIIAFCFTFIPAAGLGFMLAESLGLWAGLAIGGVVGFIIGWMIISKSFKIFNIKAVYPLVGCAIVTVAVVLGFKFDIFGYENKQPKLEDIESIRYNSSYVGNTYWSDEVASEENIKNLLAVHKDIIGTKNNATYGYVRQTFDIKYFLKNGKLIERHYYQIPVELFENSKELKAVYESDETNKYADEYLLFDPNKATISINNSMFDTWESNGILYDANIKKEIIEALVKDLNERTYEEAISHRTAYGYLGINQDITLAEYDKTIRGKELHFIDCYGMGDNGYNLYSSIMFNGDYEHLVSVLKKYGVYDKFMPSEEHGFMYITKGTPYSYEEEGGEVSVQPTLAASEYKGIEAPASRKDLVAISDTDLQRAMIENAAFEFAYNVEKANRFWVSYMSWEMYQTGETASGEPIFKRGDNAYERSGFLIDYSKLPKDVQKLIDQYL